MKNEELDIVETGIDEEDTGREEIDLDEEEGKEPPFEYEDDEVNLVAAFEKHPVGQEALLAISKQVREDYKSAWDSTEEYRQRKTKNWEVFVGNLPKKQPPFQDAANVHVPLMIENISRNLMRAYAELFGDWDNVVGVASLGPDDEVMAQVLTLHSNWQIREQIIDFKRQQWRGMTIFFVNGDVTSHSYYDPVRECNRHDMLTVDEFVVPYAYTSVMPDWSDVPFRIKIMRAYKHEIEARRTTWEHVDALLEKPPQGFDASIEQPAAQSTARAEGIEPDEVDQAAPYLLLWYEGWLELPNQDGQRFCRVVADADSDKIFELAIHEQPDWQDQQRYDAEIEQLQRFHVEEEQHATMMAEFDRQRGELEQTIAFARDMGADDTNMQLQGLMSEHQQLLQAQAGVLPPQPPAWVDPEDPDPVPQPVKMKPVHLFAHGTCLENIHGNLGLGYGQIQADHNRVANTALSQFTDAATGANLWNVFTNDLVEFDGGNQMQLGWGKVIRCTFTGDDIRKALFPMKPDPANPQLLEVVKFTQQTASSSMQSPDVLSGAPGKSGEPFRGILARIEQATKQLSVLTRRYADFLLWQIKNNALLNSIYLKDEEFFSVALRGGSPIWQAIPEEYRKTTAPTKPELGSGMPEGKTLGQFKIGRKMYVRNYHVELRSDLRFVSQSQKIQEADELVMMGKSIPYLQGNQRYQYHAVRKALIARGHYDMVDTLGPEPPAGPAMPQMPPGVPRPAMPGGPVPPGAVPPGAVPPRSPVAA